MNLILSFVDQSPSFTHGVEFGRLEMKMEQGQEAVSNNGFPVRIENKEMLIRACKLHGYTPVFGDEYYNEWIDFTAIKKTISNN